MINKNNLGWIIAGILFIVLIIFVGYISFNYFIVKSYQSGFNEGQFKLILDIGQSGNIPYLTQENNQTIVKYQNLLDWGNKYCQGLK